MRLLTSRYIFDYTDTEGVKIVIFFGTTYSMPIAEQGLIGSVLPTLNFKKKNLELLPICNY